ncbi:MAG: hypothetical protein JOZ78_24530 [Chroococcidiopsidaceae cyanobacterium CP_BM_ER_R8_30]|nr:hypothetical protein [Chroococcidiopsidaceae cyanobacterium CP_BM_ER_R8_30]
MDLDQQIQELIDNAPQDGVTPRLLTAITPGLKLLAGKLRHSQYYILQNLDHDWVATTLSHRTQPGVEKRVIYAFPSLQAVPVSMNQGLDSQVTAIPIAVTHILFQMVALETVDSTVFFETPGDLTNGIEIRREDIQNLIQLQMKQNTSTSYLPPDIA